jgi:hypothetical protein
LSDPRSSALSAVASLHFSVPHFSVIWLQVHSLVGWGPGRACGTTRARRSASSSLLPLLPSVHSPSVTSCSIGRVSLWLRRARLITTQFRRAICSVQMIRFAPAMTTGLLFDISLYIVAAFRLGSTELTAQVPRPNAQVAFPSPQVTFPTSQVPLNLSPSPNHLICASPCKQGTYEKASRTSDPSL